MNKKQLKEINDFFNNRYKVHGNSVASLDWSKETQMLRFEIFSGFQDLNNKTILDVGSGFGDLGHYLKKKYPKVKYTGYDINENFISHCENKKDFTFELRNILENPPTKKFDAVYSIGTLNSKFTGNREVTKQYIKRLFDSCNILTAISMTSSYVDKGHKNPLAFYYDPSEMFKYAKTLTKKVTLRHDYLPHDFTLILYK